MKGGGGRGREGASLSVHTGGVQLHKAVSVAHQ